LDLLDAGEGARRHGVSMPDPSKSGRLRPIGLWLGIALFFGILSMPTPASMRDVAAKMREIATASAGPSQDFDRQVATDRHAWRMQAAAAVTALVACWWIFEAIPIAATSLLPIVLFPLLGIMPIALVTAQYANHNIFLFMGGFIIALGIERWGLHRRIALHVIHRVGTRRASVVLGFLVASALLSMWISNTATALMMLPIGLAVIGSFTSETASTTRSDGNFAAALLLGIAYGASIGGVATPIGTPPNIVFAGHWSRMFPDEAEIGFGQWMLMFVPLVVVFIPLAWIVLVRVACPLSRREPSAAGAPIRAELAALPQVRGPERTMLIVFIATASLWMTRSIPVAGGDYGWAASLERGLSSLGAAPWFHGDSIKDTTVAVAMAVLLFILPAGRDRDARPRRMMDWETAQRLPWGILLLFGGGFAIAEGFRSSGMSQWTAQALSGIEPDSPLMMLAGVCTLLTFVTEITSNTATTQVMLPVIGQTGTAIGAGPLLPMLAATLSASCAFMLPVATPPNAIVFGSGRIPLAKMMLAGLLLNLIGICLISLLLYYWVGPNLGIQ
jgi:sodium-dependent dicarboxylate transporter 2/3/5